MNGPQHYQAAEELLGATQAMAAEAIAGPAGGRAAAYAAIQSVAATAQAHATLALVALMTETQIGPQSSWDHIRHAWDKAVRKS